MIAFFLKARSWIGLVILVSAGAVALAACAPKAGPAIDRSVRGDARRGAFDIEQAQCGACHEIPGIDNAHGLVGPPLGQFGRRTMVAGLLPNTPDNLVHWLRDPQAVTPGNAMPSSHLTDQQARDVAAYLYRLQ